MRTHPDLFPLAIHVAAVFGFAAWILQAYL
jgi:hypothetical protein